MGAPRQIMLRGRRREVQAHVEVIPPVPPDQTLEKDEARAAEESVARQHGADGDIGTWGSGVTRAAFRLVASG
ncbi:hypothetical protein MANY_21860 [Mycolicibacterium anyangense]|uniref:Uncharacterized protein n=1 Tax=Mycolicibacterium anyangense TaxID=1431246 RepID=A0A6N4W747_9MYCO|nr:hypothetical protein MANY_21860 [Mycolicibacterium anyangense]